MTINGIEFTETRPTEEGAYWWSPYPTAASCDVIDLIHIVEKRGRLMKWDPNFGYEPLPTNGLWLRLIPITDLAAPQSRIATLKAGIEEAFREGWWSDRPPDGVVARRAELCDDGWRRSEARKLKEGK